MCGIVGILEPGAREAIQQKELRQMLAAIRHRGPDEFGLYLDRRVGLGSARLSIIDLSTGQQPIANEDEKLWIVFNGEIFNYLELRQELEDLGHRFRTQSDTEVLLHAYEEFGAQCLNRLNGQFAFAVWNAREQTLFLARDRLGVRPLFYTISGNRLIFASEIKAILTQRQVSAGIDPEVLSEVFTYWAPLSPRTIFRGISEIPPGHYLLAHEGQVTVKSYWQITFPDSAKDSISSSAGLEDYLEPFSTLLIDAAKIRLRADVPVGAYLSGGLDSSTLAAIVRNFTTNRLNTFSIAFSDADYDESAYQNRMADFLGTEHQVARVSHADIGRIFPEVVWHMETPVMRTAPAPMFMLSKLVRDSGFKVVLTGEGADEFLAGYDIFKEAKIRQFWARHPDSKIRPKLLQKLYADIPALSRNGNSFRAEFFGQGLTEVGSPTYSHALRWHNNRRACRFFSDEASRHVDQASARRIEQQLGVGAKSWTPLARAQYLEITIFLSQYLLSSQGDRVAMAHSIEGRFPFLDHRVTAFCNRLPENLKLRGLTEKYLLKKLAQRWLPPEIWRRRKRPYRAPIHRCFFSRPAQDYVRELLSPEKLKATGLFQPAAVSQLVGKIQQGGPVSETDEMALVGIISTQLLHHHFVTAFEMPRPLAETDRVRVCFGPLKSTGENYYAIHQERAGA
ncbi:MAG TPA: asparagine synthase (glutamine-hydrolyzing) [Candidatus Acidoferrum sp.]|nr:asparagine synthase (glutamine-hydrolyzing) [Candidatus Acidoferrum sp.]